jgi:hypothetical protein
MVNVVVSRKRNIQVSSNTAGVIDTTVPVTLKNVPTLVNGVDTIDELHDVNLAQRNDGSTLVYDAPSDTYVVKKLEFVDIVGDLDGGIF